MHSFQPSRGRIFFEVLCALAVSASLAGAWTQTGASALLGAAAVAAFYGLVHLFDMRRRAPAEPAQPALVHVEETEAVDPPAAAPVVSYQQPAADYPPVAIEPVEPAQAEAEAPRPKAERKAKAPRKGASRRASAPKVAEIAEPVVAEFPLPVETEVVELAPPLEEAEPVTFAHDEDAAHPHIAPLFEPEPFARMPRRAFGRKAG